MKRTLYLIGASALLVGSIAMAQTGLGTVANQLKTDTKIAVAQEKAIAACNNITSKISQRITNFNTNRNKHIDNYIAAKQKVSDLVTNLEAKGYDVTKLKADLAEYQDLLSKLSTDYSTYITDLTATQNYACGKSEGEFRAQLLIAREQLKVVHTDDVAVHDYWKNTLKPDLQALRNSIKTTTPTTPASTTSSSTGGTN